MRARTKPQRYVALDGLRGVAALMIVIFHIASSNGHPHLLGHPRLAVDLFFMLSGFVVAAAYERRRARPTAMCCARTCQAQDSGGRTLNTEDAFHGRVELALAGSARRPEPVARCH